MSARRTYNQATTAWFKRHPTLGELRQLYGAQDVRHVGLTDDAAAAYAAEQGPVEDDESVTDYADRRGK